MTTEQNPAFQGGRSSHGGDCSSVMLVSGVWLSDLRDRMWGQEINTRHGETALPSSGSIHIIQQYLHCTIPPLIQS